MHKYLYVAVTALAVIFTEHNSSGRSSSITALARLKSESGNGIAINTGITISKYDEIIRQECNKEGLDWRFLCAIAFHESRFDANAISNKGAMGLMQIMPHVAKQFDISPQWIMDPRTNIRTAAKLIKRIDSSLGLPLSTPKDERLRIILACYNSGVGHVADARRLASKYNQNPNSWETVSNYLKLKAMPEYNCDEVVRYGVFRGGSTTSSFVNDVMNKFHSYSFKTKR